MNYSGPAANLSSDRGALIAAVVVGVLLVLAGDYGACLAQSGPAQGVAEAGDPSAHIEEILRRPMYRKWRERHAPVDEVSVETEGWWIGQWLTDRLDDLMGAIGRWLRSIFSGWRGPSAGGGGGSAVMALLKALPWVGGALALLLIAWIAWRVFQDSSRTNSAAKILSRQRVRAALERGEALAMSGSLWLREASRLAGDGEFRAVYRALYLAALSSLHESGKIDFRRNRTNWVYVSSFRGTADDRASFEELTALFDEVWYGRRPPHEPSLDAVRRRLVALIGKDAP